MSFKRPRKDDNTPKIDGPFIGNLTGYSTPDPIRFITEKEKERLESLKKIAPKAAVFTSISILNDESEEYSTDTADETEINTMPELLTSFFDPSAINKTDDEIYNIGQKLYKQYQNSCTEVQCKNLTNITKMQSSSEKWMLHRAGRITASNCKIAYTLDEKNPALSTVKIIMQYSKFKSKATEYGKNFEEKARKTYTEMEMSKHNNLTVDETGLHINNQFPFLGASPDAIVNCSCHGKRLLEIKCPFKYRDGLDGWIEEPTCPLDKKYHIKESHKYYYQIQ